MEEFVSFFRVIKTEYTLKKEAVSSSETSEL
jgi:hypothetical protein